MIILGIETSCDETAVGIVKDGKQLLAHIVASQIELHNPYGGIVPEVASRSHLEAIIPVCQEAFDQSGLDWQDIDAIGVTYGAGLAGSLLMGVVTAQVLAISKNKPLYAVNHVLGHVYANFITSSTVDSVAGVGKQPKFPLLSLIVSGKHSQLVLFEGHFKYRLLGQAIDDACGEAFDKVGRLLGLSYPGGPAISKIAKEGRGNRFLFPQAQLKNPYDFSFSGLKTAVLRQSQKLIGVDHSFPSHQINDQLNETDRKDLAASFQVAAVKTLVDKTIKASLEFKPKSVVIAGGVAANRLLRQELRQSLNQEMEYAAPTLCTDNGSMIACLACFQALEKQNPIDPYKLEVDPSLSM